jgi:hypothetical protein
MQHRVSLEWQKNGKAAFPKYRQSSLRMSAGGRHETDVARADVSAAVGGVTVCSKQV